MSKEWEINKIYVISKIHFQSYNHLKNISDPGLTVHLIKNNIFKNIILFFLLIKVRLTEQKIYIFHECSWPILDILIWFVKPKGYFLPQVTMNSYKQIKSKHNIHSSKLLGKLAINLFLMKYFNIYAKRGDGLSNKIHYYLSIKSYPKTIDNKDVNYSRDIIIINQNKKKYKSNGRQVIILADADLIDAKILCRLYNNVIDLCNNYNYVCYLKQHPLVANHLPITHPSIQEIDCSIPIELIEENYDIAIGTTSTGLINFSGKSISIIDLFDDPEASNNAKNHFYGISNNYNILFPNSYNELVSILANNKEKN
jgi:hypothetical protein